MDVIIYAIFARQERNEITVSQNQCWWNWRHTCTHGLRLFYILCRLCKQYVLQVQNPVVFANLSISHFSRTTCTEAFTNIPCASQFKGEYARSFTWGFWERISFGGALMFALMEDRQRFERSFIIENWGHIYCRRVWRDVSVWQNVGRCWDSAEYS